MTVIEFVSIWICFPLLVHFLPAAKTKVISISLASSSGLRCLFSKLKHLLNVQLHIHHGYVAICKHKKTEWQSPSYISQTRKAVTETKVILHELIKDFLEHWDDFQEANFILIHLNEWWGERTCIQFLL